MNKLCYNDFQYPFKPMGAGTFSTALNFMEEHSNYAICYYYYKITTTVDGPNDKCRKFKQVHKVDGPPLRVKTPVHNVDGPNKGQKLK